MGKIHFKKPDGSVEVWTWKAGKTCTDIRDPSGKRYTVDHSTLTGRSWDIIERGYWKQTSDCWIRPRDVREYIENNLLGAGV